MGISKFQRIKMTMVCACGCGEEFTPFPIYKSKNVINHPEEYIEIKGSRGGSVYVPTFIRGHNPRNHPSGQPSWNKGLTKETCPTLSRMGFQPGHKPYNDWSHVNRQLREDEALKAKWLESKRKQVPWNKGKKKDQYKNGFKTGAEHGNWCGGKRGIKDRSVYKEFTRMIIKRDNYTCQHCGGHNYQGRGSRIKLHAHHIVAVSEDHTLALEPSNAITLCEKCHIKTENYGTKLIHKRRKQGGK